jgi:RimJ/RimL family protein N-acetyltransferase
VDVDGQTSGTDAVPLAVCEGDHVRLRNIIAQDYEFLYVNETSGRRLTDYRFRGATPGPDRFSQSFWQGVLVALMVELKSDRRPLGTVSAYNAEFRDGHAKLAAVSALNAPHGGAFLQGVTLFIDYLFAQFPFRKLYGEVAEVNLPAFRSGLGRLFVEEGCLRGHAFHDGRYEDLIVGAIYRDAWVNREDVQRRLTTAVRALEAQNASLH